MPSIVESKRQVKAELADQQHDDHDAILASLQNEIDRHNARRHDDASDHGERDGNAGTPGKSMRFRFKSGAPDSKERKRKHRSRHTDRQHHRKHQRRHENEPAHPFPREPTDPERPGHRDTDAAFRESLFDALADDEGAAYWESVYDQPIHVYQRPSVETEKGELEQMNDEQYAAFVQTKMWEKKHPHVVQEREQREQVRREEEEDRARRREDFVRRKERAAWERAQQAGARKFAGLNSDDESKSGYKYSFDHHDRTKSRSQCTFSSGNQKHYEAAWREYLAAWDQLKVDLLNAQDTGDPSTQDMSELSKRVPWPVIRPKPVTRPNIEEFMQNMPVEHKGRSRVQLLKAERVRWHPDKIIQRFGGHVDDGIIKLVTGVFQVVDNVLAEEQKRS